jgi:hypothetical protein
VPRKIWGNKKKHQSQDLVFKWDPDSGRPDYETAVLVARGLFVFKHVCKVLAGWGGDTPWPSQTNIFYVRQKQIVRQRARFVFGRCSVWTSAGTPNTDWELTTAFLSISKLGHDRFLLNTSEFISNSSIHCFTVQSTYTLTEQQNNPHKDQILERVQMLYRRAPLTCYELGRTPKQEMGRLCEWEKGQ